MLTIGDASAWQATALDEKSLSRLMAPGGKVWDLSGGKRQQMNLAKVEGLGTWPNSHVRHTRMFIGNDRLLKPPFELRWSDGPLWRTDMGAYFAIAVGDGRLVARVPNKLLCFEAASGRELWSAPLDKSGPRDAGGPLVWARGVVVMTTKVVSQLEIRRVTDGSVVFKVDASRDWLISDDAIAVLLEKELRCLALDGSVRWTATLKDG
ncbi:MAG: PQQ-binding-like beta-propeller repeat protein [Thermoguttaceae bacterium]|jgi:outer membrane protein assembly factor BamB